MDLPMKLSNGHWEHDFIKQIVIHVDFRIKFYHIRGLMPQLLFFSLRTLTHNSLEQSIATT